MKKIMLLGSGELGKEFVIAAKRLGQYVIACDSYQHAPAMQVADEFEVFNMLDGDALYGAVNRHRPDIIVPEVEAIRTERLYDFEREGIQVVPSARAVNFTMNRKAIRDLAAKELGLKTARYRYAKSYDELRDAVEEIGMPCVVKPLMSSSGHGQSVIRNEEDIKTSWDFACSGARGDVMEVIVEEFVKFDSEITLLTVTQRNGNTLFCAPIGHVQKHGDYFSELSPRPHDTGMVTLAQTQNLNEFELHLRALLGLPVPEIELLRAGASCPILAVSNTAVEPDFIGVDDALLEPRTDLRIFGKPRAWKERRLGVALAYDSVDCNINELREKVKNVAAKVKNL